MEPIIILFDVDGVLVQPGGYRAAVQATVNHFSRQMGFGDLAPDTDTIAIFEAQGITCEWDMVPLLLCMILDQARQRRGKHALNWDTLQAAIADLSNQPAGDLQIDYSSAIRGLGRYVTPGEAPADSILTAILAGQPDAPFAPLHGQGMIAQLLEHTRRPQHSMTTQAFTTYALGDAVYQQALGLPALFLAESLLEKYDRPLLDPRLCAELNVLQQRGTIRMAAYTARPSIPDGRIQESLALFAPEAEMAIRQVRLEGAQIVGSGQMAAAALQLGENEERLTKPAPYHALASIAAAVSGNRAEALEWTKAIFCWVERGSPSPQLEISAHKLPQSLSLHIFEDSPSGMRGVIKAVELLERLGVQANLHLWGVTSHPEKMAALQAVGAEVHPDINQALAASSLLPRTSLCA